MKALITGASSGIGRDMAIYLSSLGHDLVLVSRDKKMLEEVKKNVKTNVKIIDLDLSEYSNCLKLYELVKNDNIDILVNNAGFGTFGKFEDISLDKEINMIDLIIKAVHILTKLFLSDFKKRNNGYILNVASSAAFQPGPLMATYYSTKAYVLRLTESIHGELTGDKSKVVVSVLCPGPVNTNFNKVAGAEFKLKALSSSYVAKYAIDKMFKRKLIIIPGLYMQLAYLFGRIVPVKLMLKISYNIQKAKNIKERK
jgi:short-subunit dehydrogenase